MPIIADKLLKLDDNLLVFELYRLRNKRVKENENFERRTPKTWLTLVRKPGFPTTDVMT